MLLEIKLYGGLMCLNQALPCFNLNKFELEVPQGSSLEDIYQLLNLNQPKNLVGMVDGHAQSPDHILTVDCKVSIFPPMADRQYDLFTLSKI